MKRQMCIESAQFRCFRDTEPGFVMNGEVLESCQLTWVFDGRLHSVAEGQDTLLSPNELMICVPGQWLMQYADMGSSPTFLNIIMDVSNMDLSSLAGRAITPEQDVIRLLTAALEEAQNPDAYSESMIFAVLEMALFRLLRAHSATAPANRPTAENRIVLRAQQYIIAHVCDRLSVPKVAQMADVSPSYLTALFHKHLHISPGEYIRRVKLQKSKQLIRERKMNFTEIAEVLSYSTVHHFSRQFKEKFGISPTEYAKSLQEPAHHS